MHCVRVHTIATLMNFKPYMQQGQWPSRAVISLSIILYLTVWGVEPVVPHQTSGLESTGVCGVQQNQVGGSSMQKRT